MEDPECAFLDPVMFPKHLVDRYTTGDGEAGLFVLNFAFTFVGICVNTFGLVYYAKHTNVTRKSVTNTLFIFLLSVDLITTITVGPFQLLLNVQAINFYDFSTNHFMLFSVISALFNIEVRFSMFLFMVMAFCRCIAIISPFKVQNTKIVVGVLSFYTALLSVMCFYPLFVCNDFSYTIVPLARMGQMEFLSAMNGNDEIGLEIGGRHIYHSIYLIFMEVITMMLPVIPIVITSSITAYNLVFSEFKQNIKSRRESAITVLCLTVSYVICFTPRLAIVLSTLVVDQTVVDKLVDSSMSTSYYSVYIFMTGFSLANSGINPCIALARGGNMRKYFKKSIHSAYTMSQGGFRNRIRRSRDRSTMYSNRTTFTDVSNCHAGYFQTDSKIVVDTTI